MIQDIEAKIKKDNPEFSIYLPEEPARPESSVDPALTAKRTLETRQRDVNCDPRYGFGYIGDVITARDNLRRIAGNSCKARARTCIRTQCINDAAIGICNDNYHDIDIQCTQISDWTLVIVQSCQESVWHCPWTPGDQCVILSTTVRGQVFSPGKTWNVIVGSCGFFGNPERPVKM
ncbi:hypothetical protein COCCADRAFT_174 [Bipolaris zeicola 26-R-13]|uniref:Uncharacterized protein n=1 Tax=Cochliobolus carbonum (strain 26-R-13) TaxID=930089 RepID=W6Z6X6_COCC2|nr:uncharacterized protein COCCADRAFT_174 [Bipolaris zeicola 26-R-13]EUC39436.1 hypothetical protein COCCADRAFT_174 [Bipolaris zeicola 26-R-13]